MTNSYACGDFNSKQNSIISKSISSTQPVQSTECLATVHETVCVQADITITPNVTVGDIESYCIGVPIIGICLGMQTTECIFTVSQNICVQIPVTFSADATAAPTGIVCGTPEMGPCPTTISCTYSIGFYLNHPNITQALITAAGGSIILGIDSTGLSFTVTTANAGNVLALNTPSPPAPSSPPFRGQYQNLYAQLLAANLNVLNGATCNFATATINAANTFLSNSPLGGMSGAPAIQAPLAAFNGGTAQGCPAHCLVE